MNTPFLNAKPGDVFVTDDGSKLVVDNVVGTEMTYSLYLVGNSAVYSSRAPLNVVSSVWKPRKKPIIRNLPSWF